MSRTTAPLERAEARLAYALVTPALAVILLVTVVPIGATVWEALHSHDLRLPWLGRPFVGLGNFAEAVGDPRFGSAVFHTVTFALVSVPLELGLGLALALIMHTAARGRDVIRVAALLPWAVPTVVAALVWRFMFDSQAGIVSAAPQMLGVAGASFDWFLDPLLAWVPIVLADVWKTTPFVAILLLAGLQTIDPALHEAARIDGGGSVRRFVTITLPLLRPALVVAGAFPDARRASPVRPRVRPHEWRPRHRHRTVVAVCVYRAQPAAPLRLRFGSVSHDVPADLRLRADLGAGAGSLAHWRARVSVSHRTIAVVAGAMLLAALLFPMY
jgi:ABC-type sugar transport system permease subunit